MPKYTIYLNDFDEEILEELEFQSDSGKSHECTIYANSPKNAAIILANKITPFFSTKFELADDQSGQHE